MKLPNLTIEEIKLKYLITDETIEEKAQYLLLALEGIEVQRCFQASKLIQKYKVKWSPGIPDFCYEEENQIKFIEVKSQNDDIRFSQLKWIAQNSQYPVRLIRFIFEELKKGDKLQEWQIKSEKEINKLLIKDLKGIIRRVEAKGEIEWAQKGKKLLKTIQQEQRNGREL